MPSGDGPARPLGLRAGHAPALPRRGTPRACARMRGTRQHAVWHDDGVQPHDRAERPEPPGRQPVQQRAGGPVRGGRKRMGRRRPKGHHRHGPRLDNDQGRRPRHDKGRLQRKIPDGRLCQEDEGRRPDARRQGGDRQEGDRKAVALFNRQRDRGAHRKRRQPRSKGGVRHGHRQDKERDRGRRLVHRHVRAGRGPGLEDHDPARNHDQADEAEQADRARGKGAAKKPREAL